MRALNQPWQQVFEPGLAMLLSLESSQDLEKKLVGPREAFEMSMSRHRIWDGESDPRCTGMGYAPLALSETLSVLFKSDHSMTQE